MEILVDELKEARAALDAHRKLHPQLHQQYALHMRLQAAMLEAVECKRELGSKVWVDHLNNEREIFWDEFSKLRALVAERDALLSTVAQLKKLVAEKESTL